MRRTIVILGLVLSTTALSPAIQVSGDTWGTWSADNNPYEVVGNLRVPPESTLVIEAGCYVEFQGYYAFVVDTSAVIQALGNAFNSINFTTSVTIPAWRGLRLLSRCDSSLFRYCLIERAKAEEDPPDDELRKGGGLYIIESNVRILNCRIQNNRASSGYGASYGAGVYCRSSVVEFDSCEILYNETSHNGGGLCFDDGQLIVTNCVFKENEAYNQLGADIGGGILCTGSDIQILNSIFDGNFGGFSGGGIYMISSTAVIYNCVFCNNGTIDTGGGIASVHCHSIIKSNLMFNNDATEVGGVFIFGDSCRLINNTICNNLAFRGAGLCSNSESLDSAFNNIIFNNTNYVGEKMNIYVPDGSTLDMQFSCIQDGYPGEGNIDLDPMFVDPDGGDFHLSWANFPIDDDTKSPCIDAGAPWLPLDPDSTRADIGALPYDQLSDIFEDRPNLPLAIRLHQNYPNPFNTSTMILYELPKQSRATLEIYDILGRKVATLWDGSQEAGFHQLIWDASEVSSGVYFYRLTAGDHAESKGMLLVK